MTFGGKNYAPGHPLVRKVPAQPSGVEGVPNGVLGKAEMSDRLRHVGFAGDSDAVVSVLVDRPVVMDRPVLTDRPVVRDVPVVMDIPLVMDIPVVMDKPMAVVAANRILALASPSPMRQKVDSEQDPTSLQALSQAASSQHGVLEVVECEPNNRDIETKPVLRAEIGRRRARGVE
jgi:hypothetical protein